MPIKADFGTMTALDELLLEFANMKPKTIHL
jgi:hypothetical protein